MGYDIPVENNLSDEERLEESKRLEAERNYEAERKFEVSSENQLILHHDRLLNEREMMIDLDEEDAYIEYILGDAIDDNFYELHENWINRRRNSTNF